MCGEVVDDVVALAAVDVVFLERKSKPAAGDDHKSPCNDPDDCTNRETALLAAVVAVGGQPFRLQVFVAVAGAGLDRFAVSDFAIAGARLDRLAIISDCAGVDRRRRWGRLVCGARDTRRPTRGYHDVVGVTDWTAKRGVVKYGLGEVFGTTTPESPLAISMWPSDNKR